MSSANLFLVLGICLAAEAQGDDPPTTSAATAMGIQEGSPLPAFSAKDDGSQTWNSDEHIGKRIVVLYSYPGDFTGGCIRQAASFREGLVQLEAAGIEVVGLSGDTTATHQLFKTAHALKHTLLADPDGKVAGLLGMPFTKGGKVRTRDLAGKPLLDEKNKSIIALRPVTLPRWTIVVGRDGKVISLRTGVDPGTDAQEVLKIVAGVNDED